MVIGWYIIMLTFWKLHEIWNRRETDRYVVDGAGAGGGVDLPCPFGDENSHHFNDVGQGTAAVG